MSSLNELTFSILDTIRPLNQTGSAITEEIVKYHIKNVRSQIAKQAIGKSKTLPSHYIQSLGCIPLVVADASECCSFPSGCIILRTNVPIPNTIDGATNLLTRVGPVDITAMSYQNIPYERVPFEGMNKYTKHQIKWFINHNTGYVYLLVNMNDYLDSALETINIQGALEDPLLASEFINCSTGTACFSADDKYPIPDSIVPILQQMVIKQFVLPQAQAPIDSSNNNQEDPKPQVTR